MHNTQKQQLIFFRALLRKAKASASYYAGRSLYRIYGFNGERHRHFR